MSIEKGDLSVWHSAAELDEDRIGEASERILGLRPESYEGSRFFTVIGRSADYPDLDLLTALVELTRFGEEFGNPPETLEELYGNFGDTICMLVLDTSDENNPKPASTARIVRSTELNSLPTMQVLKTRPLPVYVKDSHWGVVKSRLEEGVARVTEGSRGFLFDGATMASMSDYSDGAASMPLITAYAKAAAIEYHEFRGRFMATLVGPVAAIINAAAGYDVMTMFPGATREAFFGAEETAPHIGLIDPEQFSEEMRLRAETDDSNNGPDNSTYLFL